MSDQPTTTPAALFGDADATTAPAPAETTPATPAPAPATTTTPTTPATIPAPTSPRDLNHHPELTPEGRRAAITAKQRRNNSRQLDDAAAIELPAVITSRARAADLAKLDAGTRARIFSAFALRLAGRTYRQALRAANVEYWEIEHAARMSPTFAAIRQDVDRALRGDAAADIEDVLSRAAKGENPERGRRAPDTRAAAIVLPAIDPRYKPKETTGAPVVNIQLNV